MDGLSVCMLGKLQVRRNGEPLRGLETRKTQELLSYLLLYRGRPHARDALADVLRGDHSTEQSRKYLRQTLWHLQVALNGPERSAGQRLLQVEGDWVGINPEAPLWLDLSMLEHAFASVEGVPGREIDSQTAEMVREVTQLYQGDLLEGLNPDWCLFERDQLRHMQMVLLDKLMLFHSSRSEYESSLYYGAQVLRLDRASERIHRRMMRLHQLGGDRTAAMRQYQSCVAALREELGAQPSQSTEALFEKICSGRPEKGTPAPEWVSPAEANLPEGIAEQLTDPLERLRQCMADLLNLQRQVAQEIRRISTVLQRETPS
jgi:DNA-binding SARP family transcriptional activator